MKGQTALQIFLDGLIKLEIGKGMPLNKHKELQKLYERAHKEEKEQIKDAYYYGGDDGCLNGIAGSEMAEAYYNRTFKSE